MSLLADLLSKRNNDATQHGKEIPPTLVQTQGASGGEPSSRTRYLVLTAASAAAIGIGVFSATQFERLAALLGNQQVAAPKAVEAPKPVPPPVQIAQAPPTPAPVVTPQVEPETAPVPEKPVKKHHKPISKKSLAAPKPLAMPKVITASPTTVTKSKIMIAPPREVVLTPKVDMQARDALLYAARSAELAGDWRTALSCYRKAQKIDPENFKIMNNTAAALNNLGMFDEGAFEAKRALAKKPDYVPAMINAAIAYSSTGNSLEALLLFSKASSADPTNRTLAINLGILQERTGKLDEAKLTYRQLAEAGDPLALQGMARVYERKGNKSEAIRAYRHIMSLPLASPALKKEAKDRIMRLEE